MKKKRGLFSKIYSITILMMLFTTALAGIQVMASTDSQENKVHWESNTKDEEIQVPDGVTGDGGKWESPTYTSSDNETNNTSIETKPMSAGEEYAAIMAGLIGVLAISAAKSSSSQSAPTVSEGNGIWVPESDRDAVIKMINKAASNEYYIDANGFVKEVVGSVENPSKSSTYSSVLDRLIAGNNKVVIGVGDGWVSSGENGLEANAFTGDNSGIAIGDNGTPQVVIVSGEDMPNSSADITLAHELIHALRGEEGIKSINTIGGINQDEEAHTIELENNIREELGYEVRKDGDISDGGDGSYGKYSDSSEEDWYNNIDEMQGSETLSGNAYSLYEQSDYQSPSNPTGISQSYGPSNPSGPKPNRAPTATEIASELSDCDDDCDCDCDCDCQWGSSYDDSIWSKGGRVSVVNNVVTGTLGWRSFTVPKQNWNTFFRSNADTKKTSSGITTAVSNFADKSNTISQTGVTGALAFGVRIEGSVLFVKDSYGKWDILLTGGFGGGTPAGGLAVGTGIIKANNIQDLYGPYTTNFGASWMYGEDFSESNTSKGNFKSLGPKAPLPEVHGTTTYTLSGKAIWDKSLKNTEEYTDYAEDLNDAIFKKAQDTYDYASEKASDAYDYASEKASDTYDYASEKASDAYDYASEKASDAYDYASEKASDAYDYASEKASDAYDYVSEKASDAYDYVSEEASDAYDSLSDAASDAYDSLSDAASDAYDSLSDTWNNW